MLKEKKKQKSKCKHTYDVFQSMFTAWADHQTVHLILVLAIQSEFCQCTKSQNKRKDKKVLKQKERMKQKERTLLKPGILNIWSRKYCLDRYVFTDSKFCSLQTRKHFQQVAVLRAILTAL